METKLKAAFLFLLLVPSVAFAEGPIKNHKETDVKQEFENVYLDLRSKVSRNAIPFPSKTLAEIQVATPSVVGLGYYCSNCVTDGVCVSTGVVSGAFARISSRATACQ